MIRLIFVVFVLVFSCVHLSIAQEAGENADVCINASKSSRKAIIKNMCDYDILVVYCGELKDHKERCGDGPKILGHNPYPSSGYYTQTQALRAGEKMEIGIKGKINFSACRLDEEFTDDDNGDVTCRKEKSMPRQMPQARGVDETPQQEKSMPRQMLQPRGVETHQQRPQAGGDAVRLAAERGDAMAQYTLGLRYSKGQGVPQDYIQAHLWLNLAAAQGVQEAVNSRDLLTERMTPVQIAQAQEMARNWTPRTP